MMLIFPPFSLTFSFFLVALLNKTLESYVTSSNDCIKFKLVTCPEDLNEDFAESKASKQNEKKNGNHEEQPTRIECFNPDMSYAFFGESESIFGYKDLCVKIYYSSAKLNIYLGMTYSSIISKEQSGGVAPDEILQVISSDYASKIYTNLTEFSALLDQEKSFVPFGKLCEEFTIDFCREGEQPIKRHFGIYMANNTTAGFPDYHERLQTFLKWFIEGASYIDMDDERWEYFVMYEKLPLDKSSTRSNSAPLEFQYCFVGYCSVYRFYAFPDCSRPRIAQFFVLPPFQRIGLGTKLLKSIYTNYNDKSVVDIQVEDPSESFTKLRDVLDCNLCKNLKSYSPENLKSGFKQEMAIEALKSFKIFSRQARRVYEILRLKSIDRNNAKEYRAYRLDIKNRLNAPYQRQMKHIVEKAKRRVSKSEYETIVKATEVPKDVRLSMLAKQYEALEEEYLAVIEKLS